MHVQGWERKIQAHVDLGAHSVGKKAWCVHVSGYFKLGHLLQREKCIEGDISLHKPCRGICPLFSLEAYEQVAKQNKGRGNKWR